MINKNKYSVIIPVYNAETYIKQCIDSVLNQSYQKIELILIDDGSTDSSGKICDEYVLRDERVKVYHQENKGHTLARRKGIDIASGDFCLFLDADDYWDSNLLENVNNTISKYDCDLVIFSFKRVSEEGRYINHPNPVFKNEQIFEKKDVEKIFRIILKGSKLNHLVCKVVKRTIIDQDDYTKIKEVKTGEDLLQSIPFIINSKKTVYLSGNFYNYRNNSNSITRNFEINSYKDITIVRSIVLGYISTLQIDSDENLHIFYKTYVKRILDYILQLMESNLSKEEKLSKIQEVRAVKLFEEALKFNSTYNFSKGYTVLYELVIKKRYVTIYLYTQLLNYYRQTKSTFNKR